MFKTLKAVLFTFATLSLTLSAGATTTIRHHSGSVTDRYMVLLNTNISAAAYRGVVNSLQESYGLQIVTEWREDPRGFVANVPVSGAERLANDPRVRVVEEDFRISFPTSATQSTNWNGNYLWDLDRLDEPTYFSHDSTYDMCPEARDVNAYVIDTGVRADHEQFTLNEPASRVESYGFDSDSNPGYVDTTNGCPANANAWHGTAVASVLGGTSVGASKVHIVSLRVLDCTGVGFASNLVNAVNWIRSSSDPHRLQLGVANLSVWRGDWTNDFTTLNIAVGARVQTTLIPFFASANNFSGDACKFAPASQAYTNTNHSGTVFTVGGTSLGAGGDMNDYRWQTWTGGNTAAVGRDSGSNGGQCVSIYAPGCDIYVASNSSTTAYGLFSGTSFSAPLTAGVAARFIALTGINGYQDVYNYLLTTAGSSSLINNVATPEYWMCYDSRVDLYYTYNFNPGSCGGLIGQDGTAGSQAIHFSPTTNTSNAGMLYSSLSCPQ